MSPIQKFRHANLSERQLTVILTWLAAIYLIWLGSLKLTGVELQDTVRWLGNSRLWAWLPEVISVTVINGLVMAVELIAGVLLVAGLQKPKAGVAGAALAMLVFAWNLHYFFTNPMYAGEPGSFPWLGAGQGIIKYVAMFAVALFLFAVHRHQARHLKSLATFLAWFGVILVMGWIGFLKFQQYEAEGIVRLMESNVFFRWTYAVWDVRGASNFIGIVELIFMLGIALFPISRTLGRLGVVCIALTALGTTSFLVSVPGWNADSHFPLLNGTGIFILKDWLLFGAALILWHRFR